MQARFYTFSMSFPPHTYAVIILRECAKKSTNKRGNVREYELVRIFRLIAERTAQERQSSNNVVHPWSNRPVHHPQAGTLFPTNPIASHGPSFLCQEADNLSPPIPCTLYLPLTPRSLVIQATPGTPPFPISRLSMPLAFLTAAFQTAMS